MAASDSQEARFVRAEQILGDWLSAQSAGGAVPFEAMVAAHADFGSELRELASGMGLVDAAVAGAKAQFELERREVDRLLADLSGTTTFAQRYRVEGEVGKGGMGVVLRVLDRQMGRPLAMKVILGQAEASRSGGTPGIAPQQLQRFLNEARITGQLDHPGIVPVHEVGVDGAGRAYFTMKLVKGRTLAELLDRQRSGDPNWPRSRILTSILRVCEALAYAHGQGVVHRDLKPSNVMIGDFGEVYVMDWGLARRSGDAEDPGEQRVLAEVDAELSAQVTRTRDGVVLGTPAYMPPEQALGRIDEVGPQSDVYAIGAMLYELLSGHAPYCGHGEDSSGSAVLRRITQGPPRPLSSRRALPELVAICGRAMAYDWRQRYPSVKELAGELGAFLERRVVRAYATGAWAELVKWVQRNRALAAALLTVVVLVAVGSLIALDYANQAHASAATARQEQQRASAAARDAQLRSLALLRAEGRWDEALAVVAELLPTVVDEAERLSLLETRMLGLEMANDPGWVAALDELSGMVALDCLPADSQVRLRYLQCMRQPNPARTKRVFAELSSLPGLSEGGVAFCRAMTSESLQEAADLLQRAAQDRVHASLATGPLVLIALLTGDPARLAVVTANAEALRPREASTEFLRLLRSSLAGEPVPDGALPVPPALERMLRSLLDLRERFESTVIATSIDLDGQHGRPYFRELLSLLLDMQRAVTDTSQQRFLGLASATALPFLAGAVRSLGAVMLSWGPRQRMEALDRLVQTLPSSLAFTRRAAERLDLWVDQRDPVMLVGCVEDCWQATEAPDIFLPMRTLGLCMLMVAGRVAGNAPELEPAVRSAIVARLTAGVQRLVPLLRKHPELYPWAFESCVKSQLPDATRVVAAHWLLQFPDDPRARSAVSFVEGAPGDGGK